MSFPFGRIITYGFLTYATVFMLWTLMYSYDIASVVAFGSTASILNYIVVVLAVLIATRHLNLTSLKDALAFGCGLAFVHLVLDVVYILPAAGLGALFILSIWVNYGLALVTPLAFVLYGRATKQGTPSNDTRTTNRDVAIPSY